MSISNRTLKRMERILRESINEDEEVEFRPELVQGMRKPAYDHDDIVKGREQLRTSRSGKSLEDAPDSVAAAKEAEIRRKRSAFDDDDEEELQFAAGAFGKEDVEPGKAMAKKAAASPKAKEGVDYVYIDDDEYDYKVIKGKWHTRHTRHGGTSKSWTPMDNYPSTVKKLNDGLLSGKTQEMMQGDVREEPPGPTGPGVVNENLVRVTPAQIRRMIKSWR